MDRRPSAGARSSCFGESGRSFDEFVFFRSTLSKDADPLEQIKPSTVSPPTSASTSLARVSNSGPTEAALSSASPYLKRLLLSAFVEGTATSTQKSTVEAVEPYTFAESDEEADRIQVNKHSLSKKKENKTIEPYKTITVTDTAYSTYLAVLVWLQSSHIAFSPLLSTFLARGKTSENAKACHTAAVVQQINKDSTLPPPSSPKSVFRLAHLLELDTLPSVALSNFRSQLTLENAAYELYSDASTCYTELRDVALEFCVANWKSVREADGMKEMRRRGEAGELDAATSGTEMLLADKLFDK
jgi:hypothetical protein